MIVRSATPVSVPILFDEGFPDANIAYSIYDETGVSLLDSTYAPQAGSVSANILISSDVNTLPANAFYGYRDIAWNYTVAGAVINGEQRYSIEARLPYGVSADGVRSKLGGISPVDLPDTDIELVSAFLSFQATATAAILLGATGDLVLISIRDAIEALAGIALIPTMTVRIASKESNGTNSYQRQAIDWSAVYDSLSGIVNDALGNLITGYDPTSSDQPLFLIASPSVDAITNA